MQICRLAILERGLGANISNMERNLKYTVFAEDGTFVARCLDVEVASEGDTADEAVGNLKEALELYFEDHTHPTSPSGLLQ